MKKAIVHGCYNTTNFGDLLLLELTAKYLLEKWEIVSETIRLPQQVKLKYAKAAPSLFKVVRPTYAVFGGGGYLEDEGGSEIGTKRLLRYSIPAKVWHSLGVPYAIIAPGGGPTAVGKGAARIKYICNHASHIAIRDQQTVDFLRGIGVTRDDLVTTADLALTIQESDIPMEHRIDLGKLTNTSGSGKKIIGIHLEKIYEKEEQFDAFCNLPFLTDKDFLAKFHLAFFYDYQSVGADKVKSKLSEIEGLSFSLIDRMDHWETADFLRQLDAILTTKLHVSIVSAAFGVPVFGYSFHQKTQRFFSEIGRPQFQRMWGESIDAINDWMLMLNNDDPVAWNLSKSHMDAIKQKAQLNFAVLDDYLASRKSK